MSDQGLNRFWQELRRRKVIRVAVVYTVAAWAAVEAASVVFPTLLLPDWSLRLLVVLALIGFPVAVALAWAFEVRPEESRPDGQRPFPTLSVDTPPPEGEERLEGWKRIALHLHRDVRTVRRWEKDQGLPVRRLMHDKQATVYAYQSELDAWVANRDNRPSPAAPPVGRTDGLPALIRWGLPLLALALLVVWYLAGREDTPDIKLGEQGWVLITDFDNRTGEEVLNGTIEYALQRELTNSRIVKVAPRARIDAALKLMKQSSNVRIDEAIGREISLRDGGIQLLLTGRIDMLGGRYLLGVDLVNPSDGVIVASFARESAGQHDILEQVGALARDVRESLGGRLSEIEASQQALLKATTPSLEALKLYSEANRLMRSPERSKAAALLEQAIYIDPNFASAHLLLVYLYRERAEAERARDALERAVALAEQSTERERLFILATYYRYLGEFQREIETYELLTRLYPNHTWATGNLSRVLAWQGRYDEAVPYVVEYAEQNPNNDYAQYLASTAASYAGDNSLAQSFLSRADVLNPAPWLRARITILPAFTAWVEGEVAVTRDTADALVERMGAEKLLAFGELFAQVRSLYLALGQLQKLRALSALRSEPGWFDAMIDWEQGRPETLDAYLSQGGVSFWNATLLAMVGRAEEAKAMLAIPGIEDTATDESQTIDWIKLVEGHVAVAEGRYQEAIEILEMDFYLHFHGATRHAQQLQLNSLARALMATGQTQRAIEVLQRARAQKPTVIEVPGAAWFWLKNLRDLAAIHETVGNTNAANDTRAELSAMLAVADDNHPFLAAQ
jgi:tetratricopeptide (TPR) repeat protein